MIPAINHILVEVDLDQKDEAIIDGKKFSTGRRYNENFRERNPVVAKVFDGYGPLKKGTLLVCNNSTFDWDSQYHVGGSMFVVPMDEQIFAKISPGGDLLPLFGNLLVKRLEIMSEFQLPEDYKKNYYDRGVVIRGAKNYKTGDEVFWLKMADYEIVYTWDGVEKRICKVYHKEIVGIIKK